MDRGKLTYRLAAGILVVFLCVSASPAQTLTAEQELELETLKGQLSDPGRTPKTRVEAAKMLLSKTYPQAEEALKRLLSDSSNAGAQQAVAEAIAEDGSNKASFIEPLFTMLTGDDPLVRPAAARALATYQNGAVADRLIATAKDPKLDRSIRRVAIEALQRIVAKRCVAALIDLLDDSDPAIQSAAVDSLKKITNIRRFGASRMLWRNWWGENRDKDMLAWTQEMTDGLTRAKMSLERENAQLRDRLIKALEELYNNTSKPQQPTVLLELLTDSLGDVRLLGVMLTDRMIAANEKISEEVRQRVRMALFDSDPRVRQAVALLEADLADARTAGLLLSRLRAEQEPDVRVGLLKALGQLQSPQAVPAVMAEIDTQGDEEAAAAAAALGRIVAARPLDDQLRVQAAKVLIGRYRKAVRQKNSAGLRESLLTAMGAVGDPAATNVLTEALRDSSALIRLAGVNGLFRLGGQGAAAAVVPLVTDEDRAVRQAALGALVKLGGKDYLKTILRQLDPKAEPDPAVRKEAGEGVLAMCDGADVKTLDEIVQFLQALDDLPARTLEVQVLQRKVSAMRVAQAPELPQALRTLGRLLLNVKRPEEAAPVLAEAWKLQQDLSSDSASAREAWFDYLEAMLASNDPGAIRVMADQNDPQAFRRAMGLLQARLETLHKDRNHLAVISLAGSAVRQIFGRMSPPQRKLLNEVLHEAQDQQLLLDRQQVQKLLPELVSPDLEGRSGAQTALKAMGDRALRPLLEKLRDVVESDAPDAELEETIFDLVKQIAPDLGEYDSTAEKAQRLSKVDAWLKNLK